MKLEDFAIVSDNREAIGHRTITWEYLELSQPPPQINISTISVAPHNHAEATTQAGASDQFLRAYNAILLRPVNKGTFDE